MANTWEQISQNPKVVKLYSQRFDDTVKFPWDFRFAIADELKESDFKDSLSPQAKIAFITKLVETISSRNPEDTVLLSNIETYREAFKKKSELYDLLQESFAKEIACLTPTVKKEEKSGSSSDESDDSDEEDSGDNDESDESDPMEVDIPSKHPLQDTFDTVDKLIERNSQT